MPSIENEKTEPGKQLAPSATPMEMLNAAVNKGVSLEVLSKLLDLQERYEKSQARNAYNAAIAAAKADIPPIIKNRVVDYTSQKGRTHYNYEDLAEIDRTVAPILSKHGLSYRYRTTNDDKSVTVTCIIAHALGHQEENTLSGPHDLTGNKNAIQSIGSAITFLQRYTLKASLGLAASQDDDGGKPSVTTETISEEQIAEIEKVIAETKSSLVAFLKVAKVETLADIRADKFEAAKKFIRDTAAKRDAMASQTAQKSAP